MLSHWLLPWNRCPAGCHHLLLVQNQGRGLDKGLNLSVTPEFKWTWTGLTVDKIGSNHCSLHWESPVFSRRRLYWSLLHVTDLLLATCHSELTPRPSRFSSRISVAILARYISALCQHRCRAQHLTEKKTNRSSHTRLLCVGQIITHLRRRWGLTSLNMQTI